VLVARLRILLVALLAGASLAVAAAPAVAGKQQPVRTLASASSLERGVLAELNAIRRSHGLRPLRYSAELSAAAAAHSQTMGTRGFFAHESADGSEFWKRVQRFYGKGGFRSWTVGENLLWSSPDVDPSRALEMWMDSPGHRKNILAADWREIGIAAVHFQNAPGVYGDREVTIVATEFGSRA
jgi:uncharacterized protein YkwD